MSRGSNSDTESEPESSLTAHRQNDYTSHLLASTTNHLSSPTSKEYCVQDIRYAVERITVIDISLVRQVGPPIYFRVVIDDFLMYRTRVFTSILGWPLILL